MYLYKVIVNDKEMYALCNTFDEAVELAKKLFVDELGFEVDRCFYPDRIEVVATTDKEEIGVPSIFRKSYLRRLMIKEMSGS